MRNRFDEQLAQLNRELTEMGSMCEIAIHSATQALFESHRPHEAIEKTAEIYEEISRKERDIENLCMKLLLQQQPVARDLRVISSALKMIYDMQRIGNQASDITEIIRFVKGEDVINRIHIKKMTAATTKMVADSISSFVSKDLVLAQSVIAYDDVVDELFSKVREELVGILTRHPDSGAVCVDLLMVSKYLERIGDHAVNIAGWVVYSIAGTHAPTT
ncbi:MAG: phosphate transport system regulatory protein PhoU [Clostridiales bacterium]|jgi:phosphate transport system protein|nr:MAG: phosphate transport system regulatory protein PhoU [Clostridiales bacterium]